MSKVAGFNENSFKNFLYIPESFNTNSSHQLLDYKITFVNSQYEKRNSKGDFVLKKPVRNVRFKDFWYTKINLTQIFYDEFN